VLPNFGFNQNEILAFALVLIRISTFVVAWPIFTIFTVPAPIKILFAFSLALLLFPTIDRSAVLIGVGDTEVIWYCAREAFVGLLLGFISRMFFFAISSAGQLMATQMGLANGQMFNPAMGASVSTVEHFFILLGSILFISLNGHHHLISVLSQSFSIFPMGPAGIDFALFKDGGGLVTAVMEAGIKLSGPIIVAVLLVNLTMAVVGRAVPQINVLVTSMPLTLFVGLCVMIVTLPAILFQLDHEMIFFLDQMMKALKKF
jgi:flagellar biosynthesis protein FliR